MSERAAAFFDLDKTILAKSSSLAFAKPLYDGGLIGRSDVLKSAYAQLVYLTSGADRPDGTDACLPVGTVQGWDVDQVNGSSPRPDGIVDPIVYQEAIKLIAEHHEAAATSSSSPRPVPRSLSRSAPGSGVDKAIGTQMVIEDASTPVEILFYAYGPGKADAMRQLAEDEGYDLSASYAYSDSHGSADARVVGHPFAVNPDERLRRVARERCGRCSSSPNPSRCSATVSKEQRPPPAPRVRRQQSPSVGLVRPLPPRTLTVSSRSCDVVVASHVPIATLLPLWVNNVAIGESQLQRQRSRRPVAPVPSSGPVRVASTWCSWIWLRANPLAGREVQPPHPGLAQADLGDGLVPVRLEVLQPAGQRHRVVDPQILLMLDLEVLVLHGVDQHPTCTVRRPGRCTG